MATIIEQNTAYAADNEVASERALMASCESFIGSELAYAAATGGKYVDIDCSHEIHADTVITWQAEHEDATTSTTEVSATIGELMVHDWTGLYTWLEESAGVSSITLQNGHDITRITVNGTHATPLDVLDKVSAIKLAW